jgi:hypothetical protein
MSLVKLFCFPSIDLLKLTPTLENSYMIMHPHATYFLTVTPDPV